MIIKNILKIAVAGIDCVGSNPGEVTIDSTEI